jgi:hypothetical protein
MATYVKIPLDSTTSTFELTVILDGIEFVFRFNFNTRSRYWHMSIIDTDGVNLLTGKKITVDRPLLKNETNPNLPPGELWLIDTHGLGADAGLRDLGNRHTLVYVEAA